jgi:hypothetical protein
VRRRRTLPSLLLGAVAATFIVCLTLFQVTGPVAGPRLLGRLAAAMIELDYWLPAHRDDLEASARERPRVSVEATGLPVSVFVPSSAVLADGGSRLGPALASALGDALYSSGRGAFTGNGSISITEPARWVMELLRPRAHRLWGAACLALLALALILSAIAAISTEGPPLRAVLRPVAIAGAAVATAGAFSWLLFRVGALLTGPSVNGEVLMIGRDVAGVALRDGFGICLGAAAILLLLGIASPDRGDQPRAWPRSDQRI